jgi:hypothetical protein
MPKKSKHPGLRAHSWRTAGGEIRTAYYLDNRAGQHQADGPQEIRLGTDYERALQRWRELVLLAPMQAGTIGEAMARWERDELPGYRESTRRDYGLCLSAIRPVFGPAAWSRVDMPVLARYLAERKAKTRANRELALLSIVWGRARLWGMTKLPYPAAGVKHWKNKETPRTSPMTTEVFKAVREHACWTLGLAMDTALATAMRLTDVLGLTVPPAGENRLVFVASKTGKPAFFDLRKSPLLQDVLLRRSQAAPHMDTIVVTPSGKLVSERMLRDRWDRAASLAAGAAKEAGNAELAEAIEGSWMRDHRKLAAKSTGSAAKAARLLQHSSEAVTRAHYFDGAEELEPAQ